MSTVLVVDDDPATLSLVTGQLTQEGHDVIAADNPAQAISMLERGREPQVAVLDISMPEMTGFELAQIIRMRDTTAKLPVIFLSSTLEQAGEYVDDDGITAIYMTKGTPPATLCETVAQLSPERDE